MYPLASDRWHTLLPGCTNEDFYFFIFFGSFHPWPPPDLCSSSLWHKQALLLPPLTAQTTLCFGNMSRSKAQASSVTQPCTLPVAATWLVPGACPADACWHTCGRQRPSLGRPLIVLLCLLQTSFSIPATKSCLSSTKLGFNMDTSRGTFIVMSMKLEPQGCGHRSFVKFAVGTYF